MEEPQLNCGQSIEPAKKTQPPVNLNSITGALTLSGKPIEPDGLFMLIGKFRKCQVTEYIEGRGKHHKIFDNYNHAYDEKHDFKQQPLQDAFDLFGVFVKKRDIAEPCFWLDYPKDEAKVCSPFRWISSTWTQMNCLKYCLDSTEPDEYLQNLVWKFEVHKQGEYFAPNLTKMGDVDQYTTKWVWNVSKNW